MTETRYPPIADYAAIGDCHGVALVSRDGSIDWCCFHRFDSRPVFCRILDWDKGGSFGVAPSEEHRVTRRYLPGTNILETTFETDGGTLVVVDAFPVRESLVGEDDERLHPYHQLIRRLRCTEGEVEVAVTFEPRFDYGTTGPRLDLHDEHLATVVGGADALILHSDLPLEKHELAGCGAQHVMRAGDEADLVLTYELPHRLRPRRIERGTVDSRMEETERFWTTWSDRCTYDGPYREAVVRSALTIKLLTNSPTGAIAAAATTSLPESVGGVRNWDYRYTWLRDSTLALFALFALGYTEEAHDFFHWLERTTAGKAEELQVMYGVGGEHLLPEHELPELEGYRGSRPVRIGNHAYRQFQLDAYGELLDSASLFHRAGGDVDDRYWGLLSGAVGCVVEHWEDPDKGIWEVRGGPKHFVYSKVMCWVALDRAINLSEKLGRETDVARWIEVRDAIRDRVLSEGVDPETGAFTQAFGEPGMDAANLLIPLRHFVPGDDDRVRATADRVWEELGGDGLIHRYKAEDGLPGDEGAFLICSFWMVDNLVLMGEADRARELFEKLLGYANDVGLYAEEIDPSSGEFLGNFPQAFSHLGLINSAIQLMQHAQGVEPTPLGHEAERSAGEDRGDPNGRPPVSGDGTPSEGYRGGMNETSFSVRGMSCGNCEASIREALGGISGVETVEADHAAGRVVVRYEPGSVEEGTLRDRIDDLGFEVVG